MATEKQWSITYFIDYGNQLLQDAARTDWEKNFKKMNYPNKDEYKDILAHTEMDCSATLEAIPKVVGSFVADTGRPFSIPAPNDNTTSAIIKLRDVPESESEGVIQFGDHKGESWKSKTLAHEEFSVKNNAKPFKVKE